MATENAYRFADCAVIEPLINSWSAWGHVITPALASLHLHGYQLRTMRSYLADPQQHVNANRDPELIGGPFMDIPVERAEEVARLLEETESKQANNLIFARALLDFHNWLVAEAKGQSLEPYYRQIPEPLRGYVELVYDYDHKPVVRLLESLLYESPYYDEGLQSLRLFPLRRDDTRPFFMSTPRLMEEGHLDWRIPFSDWRVDELFRLDVTPRRLVEIRELLGLSPEDDEALLSVLSSDAPAPAEKRREKRIRVRYFGHACLLIEYNGVVILTDPFVGAVPTEGGLERFTYADLPAKIDYALVTHNHQDHYALETLLRLRHRIECLVVPRSNGLLWGDLSLKLMSRKLGFRNVVEVDALEALEFGDGAVIAAPFFGEHGDLAHSKTAYVIRAGEQQMLVAADSDCLDVCVYENLRKCVGPIETVFLGMECVGAPLTWSCGPLFPKTPQHSHDQTRRHHGSNAAAGLAILEAVGARRFFNYAMGMEPWQEHLLGLNLSMDSTQIRESDKLMARARALGLEADRLYARREFFLDDLPATPMLGWREAAEGARFAAQEESELDHVLAGDAKDQFVF